MGYPAPPPRGLVSCCCNRPASFRPADRTVPQGLTLSSEGRPLPGCGAPLPSPALFHTSSPAVAPSPSWGTPIPQPELCPEDSGPWVFEESAQVLNERSGLQNRYKLNTSPGSGWWSSVSPLPLPKLLEGLWGEKACEPPADSHREELNEQCPACPWGKVKSNIKKPSVAGGLHHIFFKSIYNKHIQGL